MASILCLTLEYLPEYVLHNEHEGENDEEQQQQQQDPSDEHDYKEEGEGFFTLHVMTFCKSFFQVMVPHGIQGNVCEAREFKVFLQSPTFEYCTTLGFMANCSSELIIEAVMKVNRFITSFDRWGDVSDPELRRVIIEMCPRLENIQTVPAFESRNPNDHSVDLRPSVVQLVEHFDFLLDCAKRHPNPLARASAAYCFGQMLSRNSRNFYPNYPSIVSERSALRLLVSNLVRDGMRDPSVFLPYLDAIDNYVRHENATHSLPLSQCALFSEFEPVFDLLETIFENGDERILLNINFLLDSLGYLVADFLTNNRLVHSLRNDRNPLTVRKIQFLRRYKNTLFPRVITVLLDQPDVTHLDDTRTLGFAECAITCLNCCRDDRLFCEEVYPIIQDQNGMTVVSGLCPASPTKEDAVERVTSMITFHHRQPLRDLPLEPFVDFMTRLTTTYTDNSNDIEQHMPVNIHVAVFNLAVECLYIGVSASIQTTRSELALSFTNDIPRLQVWLHAKEVPRMFSTGLFQEFFPFLAAPLPQHPVYKLSYATAIFNALRDLRELVIGSLKAEAFFEKQPRAWRWFATNHRTNPAETRFEGSVLHSLAQLCINRYHQSIAPQSDQFWKEEVFEYKSFHQGQDEDHSQEESHTIELPGQILYLMFDFRFFQLTRKFFFDLFYLLSAKNNNDALEQILSSQEVTSLVAKMFEVSRKEEAFLEKYCGGNNDDDDESCATKAKLWIPGLKPFFATYPIA